MEGQIRESYRRAQDQVRRELQDADDEATRVSGISLWLGFCLIGLGFLIIYLTEG